MWTKFRDGIMRPFDVGHSGVHLKDMLSIAGNITLFIWDHRPHHHIFWTLLTPDCDKRKL